MKEDLLHFIWQRRLLPLQLCTTKGLNIEIIHPGTLNYDAGPDFFNARIRIGNAEWAGNVEMHVCSGMWNEHRHQFDAHYENVILHVVYHHDVEIINAAGCELPVLELRNYIPPLLTKKYELLHRTRSTIPCEPIFSPPSDLVVVKWMERLLVERLEMKCAALENLLQKNNHHWDDAFYKLTARYFGMKTNSGAFETLAGSLPLHVLAKHSHSRIQVEALIFGTAGFLTDVKTTNSYIARMANEFSNLKNKYDLASMNTSFWKFSRMRPANFPTVRLAQFAALFYSSSSLLIKALESANLGELEKHFRHDENSLLDVSCLHRSTTARRPPLSIGKEGVRLLLINSILPMLFWYGKCQRQEELCERAIRFYEEIGPENNLVSRYWKKKGIPARSAADSQALLQLHTQYCNKLRCLSCAIGNHLLLKSTA